MAVSFIVLAKCADWLVEGAIDVARRLHVPQILIGIVLVSLGTTAPELAVSVNAALSGQVEISLGNAIGSVIYDDGLALPLVAILAPATVIIDRTVLRSAAIFLIVVDILAYALCFDGALVRIEGFVLVGLFFIYLGYACWEQIGRKERDSTEREESGSSRASSRSWGRILFLFILGLTGVLISSNWIVLTGPVIAEALGVPSAIVGLAFIALGTSIPEVATCIVAARKGEGGLAVGNILGADILNVCWIAGASAIANDLVVAPEVIHFMFPAMLIIVFTMLGLLRLGYRFEKWKGGVLLALCAAYLIAMWVYKPGALQSA